MVTSDEEIIDILTRSFERLTPWHKANLRYHVRAGTRILCGSRAGLYANAGGA